MSFNSKPVIMVFLKYPTPGKVKTRLAKTLGQFEAAEVYRLLAEKVIEQTVFANYQQVLLIEPPELQNDFKNWLGDDKTFHPQRGGNIGERMIKGFQDLFLQGASHVIAVGSDCPEMDSSILKAATTILTYRDCVIGPAMDGGYYLIGFTSAAFLKMQENLSPLFEKIEWSTSSVYTETIVRLENYDLSYGSLPCRRDVDTLDDYVEYLYNNYRNGL